jgi:hypothetical protein
MYEAKGERASHIYLVKTRSVNGMLLETTEDGQPAEEAEA